MKWFYGLKLMTKVNFFKVCQMSRWRIGVQKNDAIGMNYEQKDHAKKYTHGHDDSYIQTSTTKENLHVRSRPTYTGQMF